MDSFLKLVANDLYKQTGGNLAHTAVVFPNKRASLFFNEHLAAQSDVPLWSPSYISISDLFRGLSHWEVADPIKLVCELYKVFVESTSSKESLDDFYFWGEMMISDFDDADKNLVDTERMFTNLQDLKNIMDDHSYLDEEQEEAIQQFFQHFSIEQTTVLKERFISLWNVLGDIYKKYHQVLASQNLAYEGMLYREVLENLDINQLPYQRYVFVGFNVLNKVEQQLFKKLQAAGRALFYWDYDHFYLDGTQSFQKHEAGEFIRRNLRDFPSTLSGEDFRSLSGEKKITYVAAPTENAQARYLPAWIREHITEKEKETAVVLCNEALLQPVLHSLPENVEHVNVTMGFPLSQTPIYSFVNALIDLYIIGYNKQTGRYTYQSVVTLLKHPYTQRLSDQATSLEKKLTKTNRFYPLPSELQVDAFLTLLFEPPTGNNLQLCERITTSIQQIATMYQGETNEFVQEDAFNQLYRESLFKAYTTINRFHSLIEEGDLLVQAETLRRLITKVLSGTNIPFHGEPAIGMQVMGVLETRNLDFRHLIMLSVNEGQLPKSGGEASFIPYNLRKAFGMTTIEHKIAVYAYYFYRLIQRAEEVTLVYNTTTEGLNRGEWSRFMLQFLIEWPHPIERRYLEATQSPIENLAISIPKTDEVLHQMQSIFDLRVNKKAKFSPTALNTYLDCPLKFYYKYVAGLKLPDEVSADIDAATFGSIFHLTAQHIYDDLTSRNKVINKEVLEELLKDKIKLESYVDDSFKELFFHMEKDERPEYNGLQRINAAVVTRYIKQLLEKDALYAPFTYVGSEQPVFEDINIQTPRGVIKSRIGGIIDRMDSKDGTLRIVDYKTGGTATSPVNVEALFLPDKKRSNYIFQTFLYAAIMCQKQTQKVAPSLLYIHKAAKEEYSPVITMGESRMKEEVNDFGQYEEEFRELLKELLEEIFQPELPFTQTEIKEKCVYCDFKSLCRR